MKSTSTARARLRFAFRPRSLVEWNRRIERQTNGTETRIGVEEVPLERNETRAHMWCTSNQLHLRCFHTNRVLQGNCYRNWILQTILGNTEHLYNYNLMFHQLIFKDNLLFITGYKCFCSDVSYQYTEKHKVGLILFFTSKKVYVVT